MTSILFGTSFVSLSPEKVWNSCTAMSGEKAGVSGCIVKQVFLGHVVWYFHEVLLFIMG